MALVILTSSLESYGDESDNTIFDNLGGTSLSGEDFGDIETGVDSPTKFYYLRHDGAEPIYDVGIYLKAIGVPWGGYVADAEDARFPYNPNFFKFGGLDEDDHPQSSTEDYNFLRKAADNDPEMGVRIHMDREDPSVKTEGLGADNVGLNFSPIILDKTSLDTSKTSDDIDNGYIYPEPDDSSKTAKVGDEALIGVSLQLPEETEGSGILQFSVAVKYRYTT
jgi:hypothetical protein